MRKRTRARTEMFSHGEDAMAETKQRDTNLGDAAGASRRGEDANENKHSRRTAGTNRDFDNSEQADNQKHGHPREERERRSKD
jgi:hypothetical protein